MLFPILLAILLGSLALAFVLYPIYGQIPDPIAANEQNTSYSHENRKKQLEDNDEQASRTALQEVELDYQIGNISEQDYRSLRERYMQRALRAFRSRAGHEQEERHLDDEIEAELRRMRGEDGEE